MRRTQGEWARIVARHRASGLSVRRFCAEERINEKSLRRWARKLDGHGSRQTRRDAGFVEVGGTSRPGPHDGERAAVAATGDGLVIRLEGGVGIEVGPQTDRELLGWVLTLLRHAS